MKKQMKTNLFTATLGICLTGIMLSSSTDKEAMTTANQAPTGLGLQAPTLVANTPTSVPFTVYLSLLTAFTNGQSIDFNALDEDGQSSILDKMTNWREKE